MNSLKILFSPTSSPQKGGCLLPPPPENGSYTGAIRASENRRSACRQVPGTPVRENWILSFVCNEGYYFKETQNENFIAFCGSGKWYPKIPVCRSKLQFALKFLIKYVREEGKSKRAVCI